VIAGGSAHYGRMGWDAAQMQPTAVGAAASGSRALSRGGVKQGQSTVPKLFGQLLPIVPWQHRTSLSRSEVKTEKTTIKRIFGRHPETRVTPGTTTY